MFLKLYIYIIFTHHIAVPATSHHQPLQISKKKPKRCVWTHRLGFRYVFVLYIYSIHPPYHSPNRYGATSQHRDQPPPHTSKLTKAQTTCLDASFGLEVCFYIIYIYILFPHHITAPTTTALPHSTNLHLTPQS